MKTLVIATFVFVSLVACTKNAEQKTEQKTEQLTGEIVKIDPVCQMEGKNEITFVHDNKTYLFCSENCQADFKKDPAKYLTASSDTTKKADTPADSTHKM